MCFFVKNTNYYWICFTFIFYRPYIKEYDLHGSYAGNHVTNIRYTLLIYKVFVMKLAKIHEPHTIQRPYNTKLSSFFNMNLIVKTILYQCTTTSRIHRKCINTVILQRIYWFHPEKVFINSSRLIENSIFCV